MSKILFAWELGEGMGHLLPHLGLLTELSKAGHQIHLVLQDLRKAIPALGTIPCSFWQAPFRHKHVAQRYNPTFSYAHIMHNIGLGDTDDLTARMIAWRNLLMAIKPDLVIADYCPTLLLAMRGLDIPCIGISNGFCTPAKLSPYPLFKTFRQTPPNLDLSEHELKLKVEINKSLQKLRAPQIDELCDMFDTQRQSFLRVIPDFDPYGFRVDACYLGIPEPSKLAEVKWPESKGERVFAYLKSFPLLEEILKVLSKLDAGVLISSDGISPQLQQKYQSEKMVFANRPVSLVQVAETVSWVLTNGTLSTSIYFALRGIPQINILLNLETEITSHLLEELGYGKTVHPRQEPGRFAEMLREYSLMAIRKDGFPRLGLLQQKYPEPFKEVYHQPIVNWLNSQGVLHS